MEYEVVHVELRNMRDEFLEREDIDLFNQYMRKIAFINAYCNMGLGVPLMNISEMAPFMYCDIDDNERGNRLAYLFNEINKMPENIKVKVNVRFADVLNNAQINTITCVCDEKDKVRIDDLFNFLF
jgi:hypothetical protein